MSFSFFTPPLYSWCFRQPDRHPRNPLALSLWSQRFGLLFRRSPPRTLDSGIAAFAGMSPPPVTKLPDTVAGVSPSQAHRGPVRHGGREEPVSRDYFWNHVIFCNFC